jgi:hypothetical protein
MYLSVDQIACGSYHAFLDRWLLLTRKLLNQGFLVVKLKSSPRKFYGHHHELGNSYAWRNHNPVIFSFMPHMERELLVLPEHLSSPPVFSGVRVARSLIFYVMFCRSLFVLFSFFFWHLCCLLFFDYGIWLPPLVSSNFC